MKTISHITIHILSSHGVFTVTARTPGKTGKDNEADYPLDTLPLFEAELIKRGYVRKPGVFDWLRWYERITEDIALPDMTD